MNVAKSFFNIWTAPTEGEIGRLTGSKGGRAVYSLKNPEKKRTNLAVFKNISKSSN
jgi:hypothetical protein